MSRPVQLETITTQLKSAKGVAEKFKAQGQPARVRQMNHLHTSGKEIVLHELLSPNSTSIGPISMQGPFFHYFPPFCKQYWFTNPVKCTIITETGGDRTLARHGASEWTCNVKQLALLYVGTCILAILFQPIIPPALMHIPTGTLCEAEWIFALSQL